MQHYTRGLHYVKIIYTISKKNSVYQCVYFAENKNSNNKVMHKKGITDQLFAADKNCFVKEKKISTFVYTS